MVGLGAKRAAVAHLQAVMSLSELRACSIVGADRMMIRYAPTARRTRLCVADCVTSTGFIMRKGSPSASRRARRKPVGTRAPILVEAANPDQPRRSSVAPPPPLCVQNSETLIAAG